MSFSDPFARASSPASAPAQSFRDPFGADGPGTNPFDRPERVEDRIPRHSNPRDGRPHIWLPDGSQQRYYSRPSSWGKKVEDATALHKWETRVVVDGFLSYEHLSDALQAEWAATGPEEKDKRWALCERAKELIETSARVGTAVHAITERWDLGLEVHPPKKHKADLEEWKRLTQNFEIVTLADGRPGVEVFVTMDALRPPTVDMTDTIKQHDGSGFHYARIVERDPDEWSSWVRLGGTFDRLWKYKPCPICGCRNYIGDLKTGQPSVYSEPSYSVQEAVYSRGKQYVPHADGRGATRFDLPDVCQHRGIIVYLPSGTGRGIVKWVNIAKAYDVAIGLVPDTAEHRRQKNWLVEFTPTPDVRALIDAAVSVEEVRGIWRTFPDEFRIDPSLIEVGSARITALGKGI